MARRNILIITTAHLTIDDCSKVGMEFTSRIEEYKKSFEFIKNFLYFFEEIYILETREKKHLDYLEESGFKIFYSEKENPFMNKGLNEFFHINEFLKRLNLNDEDFIYKVTGRYKILNLNINNYDEFDCVAKNDSDIYPIPPTGVHTFWFKIKLSLFNDFYKFVNCDGQQYNFKSNICIEWELFNFMEKNKKCLILPSNDFLGIQTCIYDGEKWVKNNV